VSRKICVVTGTRAEYGLMRRLTEGIRADPDLTLQLVVTGMHLAPEFGSTWREIERDGFVIDEKVEMLLSADTGSGVAKSTALGLIGISQALDRLTPDILVILGDRFETLAAATAALFMRVPVAHLHGGEITEGAIDEAMRHAITKMSHLHFVAADEYRRRVIQLGEQPERVFLVGGLGVDIIKSLPLLDREAVEEALDLPLGKKSLLITFHPATLERASPAAQTGELLAALHGLEETQLIFTLPNADPGGREIAQQLNAFAASHPNAVVRASLGQNLYLSCMKHVDGVIGNSSSGLAEAPSFGIGTVNIGERQRGRLKADSVIDCAPQRAAISAAIAQLYSVEFQQRLSHGVRNPYGDGGASDRILKVLHDQPLADIRAKTFYDLKA
jgi:GDP/UDP-N,N'-diacetylbacillosamine 2-epimerase (hydrolysing)